MVSGVGSAGVAPITRAARFPDRRLGQKFALSLFIVWPPAILILS
jgi:hypothetical protein